MSFFNKETLRAFSIHLLISGVIATMAWLLVYYLWYPSPFGQVLNVKEIFLLILGVDIFLGPLMTLVVYKPNKSSLTFDLTVIACIQLAALVYGLHTVGSGRPAYLVFTKDRFDLVQAHEVVQIAAASEQPVLSLQSPWLQPVFGYDLASADVPTGVENYAILNLLTSSAMNGGADVPNVKTYHKAYAHALPKIKTTAKTLSSLNPANASIRPHIATLQAKYPANSLLSPLKIKFTIYTVVMHPNDGQILGIEPFDVF